LGCRLEGLALRDTYIWETEIDELYLEYLKEHQICQTVLMPHTAYLEIALAAAKEVFDVKYNQINNLKLHHPLFLSEKEERKIQVVLATESNASLSFHLYSCQINQSSSPQGWTLYATAQVNL
jgi:acyl transferase domain-containing protein